MKIAIILFKHLFAGNNQKNLVDISREIIYQVVKKPPVKKTGGFYHILAEACEICSRIANSMRPVHDILLFPSIALHSSVIHVFHRISYLAKYS